MSEESLDGEVIDEKEECSRGRETGSMFTGEKNGLLGRAPEREQDEREAEGRAGDKPTNPTSHPIFTAAFTLHQTFRKLLENEMQEKIRLCVCLIMDEDKGYP